MKKSLKPVITQDEAQKNTFLVVVSILPVYTLSINPRSKTTSKRKKLKINWLNIYYSVFIPVFLLILFILSETELLVFKATSLLLIFLIFISPLLPKIKKLKLPLGIELETTLTAKEKQ